MPPSDRLQRAGQAAARTQLDALLITPSADLRYLAAYDPPPLERLTCLVVRPGRTPVLLVPELERPLAEQAAASVTEIVSWTETEDPYAVVRRIVGKGRRVACADRMWAAHFLRIQRALPHASFTLASRVLEPLRAIKDEEEIGRLRRAARYADETYGRVIRSRLESATERDVAARLSALLLEMGNEQVTFTIVGSGPNGASPHHEPGERALQAGDAVVMDFGGRAAGYCSDITRTIAVREASAEIREVHDIVREAQDRALSAVRPGVPAQEVDRAAREVIEHSGYGDRFVHRTGHGIGLEEHEDPYIVGGNCEPLAPGHAFSVEPGIYVPGEFGFRLEDIVVATDDGPEELNRADHALVVVDA
jgi:Xaa-Pro aminopeptidase